MHVADGFSGVVILKEPEPAITRVQQLYNQLCKTIYNYVVCGRLDTLLTPANYADIASDNAPKLMCHDTLEHTLLLPNGKVLCSEYNPAHLSFLQMERYQRFDDIIHILQQTDEMDERIRVTDITSLLVQTKQEKKGKVSYILENKVASNNGIKTTVTVSTPQGDETKPVRLTTKVDLPDKVHLAKLIRTYGEDLTICVYTQPYGETAWRYYTVASLKDGTAHAIWTNFDSSYILF